MAAHPSKFARDAHKLLRDLGWKLERDSGSHRVYRHPEIATTVVISGSPSDRRAWLNAIGVLRRLQPDEFRGQVPVGRRRSRPMENAT